MDPLRPDDAPAAVRAPEPPVLPETSPHEPTVRPWELELLISGAVVFSLLQVPSQLDRWFAHVEPHLAEQAGFAAFMGYIYAKLILYTLISCFVVHLSVRAYWVGLIGLESVFPHGVRWEDSNYAPVMREVYRERIGKMQPRIDAADRFCSILFPLAFTVVMLFFFSIAVLGATAGVGLLLSRLLFGGEHFSVVVISIFTVAMIIPMVTWAADRWTGGRLERGSLADRLLRRASVASYFANAMPILGITFMTLITNAKKGSRYPAMYLLLAILFGVVFVKDVAVGRGLMIAGDHLYLPDAPGAFGVAPVFYESQRKPDEVHDRIPSIQSDVIRDPYVKLFIPYVPVRHGAAFAEKCPGVRPLSPGGVRSDRAEEPDSAAVRAVLECWTRLQPVALNGRSIHPSFRFYTHPRSGLRGIVAYVPVAGLPRGENALTVALAPRSARNEARRRARGLDRADEPYYIPFWL
jgi:hypothetical protein